MKPEGGPCGAFLQRRRYGSLILEESYYYVKPTSVFCNACVGTSVLVMYLLHSKKREKKSLLLLSYGRYIIINTCICGRSNTFRLALVDARISLDI